VDILLHEVCFKTKDNYLLEGSTFGIFGIDDLGVFHLIPTEKNTSQNQEDLNEGTVLKSTCMILVKKALENAKLPFKEKKIKIEKAKNLERLFAISSTRLLSSPTEIKLLPIRSMDGQLMKSSLSDKASFNIEKLQLSLNHLLYNYSHEIN
jgi:hypothetical protein